ncbi:MAG TPA: 3-methyl-2-oxobutanoate hydroxymethyltransferase [Gemmataceae bacterium]|nr:3-methyl-2-oxobutanoate hydroxymethyltransferase [Gemmataceae bacterium]
MTTTVQPQGSINGPAGAAAEVRRVTVPDFLAAKSRGVRLTMLTAYDYTLARLLDAAGVDGLLVGDSLGMVVQGNEHSLGVTLDEVIYHTRLVARGVRRCLLVADMPFMTFQVSPQQALENAGRLVKEGGAHAVKLEGGVRSAAAIEAITRADIPVMGHVGLTPQSIRRFGGFRVQRDETRLLEDALATQEAGAFAVVIECVPAELAQKITTALHVPTIGIGAGAGCDGQILVTHDMLGLFDDIRPRFVKQYADLGREIVRAVECYCREVREGGFPGPEHSFR